MGTGVPDSFWDSCKLRIILLATHICTLSISVTYISNIHQTSMFCSNLYNKHSYNQSEWLMDYKYSKIRSTNLKTTVQKSRLYPVTNPPKPTENVHRIGIAACRPVFGRKHWQNNSSSICLASSSSKRTRKTTRATEMFDFLLLAPNYTCGVLRNDLLRPRRKSSFAAANLLQFLMRHDSTRRT